MLDESFLYAAEDGNENGETGAEKVDDGGALVQIERRRIAWKRYIRPNG